MKPSIFVVKMRNTPILQQLQWEEALLRADKYNWCLFNWGSPPAIVMGISGDPSSHLNLEKLCSNPIPVIRRFSGGGTVVVDHNTLFITLIVQASSLNIMPYPRPLMAWTEQLYHPVFKELPFALKENDYTFGEKKWGGNAQAIIKDRWLHHSSLLWDFDRDLMDYLQIPPKTPQYRNKRSHNDFLCKLSEHIASTDLFEERFFEALAGHFTLKEENVSAVEQVVALPHRKSTQILR